MDYKLITIDLDDTLLRDDLTISKRNITAIAEAVRKGVKVTLASGRATPSVSYYLDILGLEIPIIAYQGARIVDIKNKVILYKKEINPKQALPIIQYAEKMNVHCNVFIDDVIYIEKANYWSQYYQQLSKVVPMKEVGKLSNFLNNQSVTKIIFIDEHERLKELKQAVEVLLDDGINVYFSKPNYLEFTNKYGTKGEAVKFLGEYFNIKREEIIAIGDTYNDISMIEYAGLGVCMQNGTEAAKEVADYITLSNEDDGVAHVIHKFVLTSDLD